MCLLLCNFKNMYNSRKKHISVHKNVTSLSNNIFIRLTRCYFLPILFLILSSCHEGQQNQKVAFHPKATYQFSDSLKGLWQTQAGDFMVALKAGGLSQPACKACVIEVGKSFGMLNSDYIREVHSNLRSLPLENYSDEKLKGKFAEILQESLTLIEGSSDGFLGETVMINDSTPVFKSEVLLSMKQALDSCLKPCSMNYSVK